MSVSASSRGAVKESVRRTVRAQGSHQPPSMTSTSQIAIGTGAQTAGLTAGSWRRHPRRDSRARSCLVALGDRVLVAALGQEQGRAAALASSSRPIRAISRNTAPRSASSGDLRHQPVLLEDASVVRPGEESRLVFQSLGFDEGGPRKLDLVEDHRSIRPAVIEPQHKPGIVMQARASDRRSPQRIRSAIGIRCRAIGASPRTSRP